MKFHINNEGNPGKCSAVKEQCPFGNENEHYSSAGEAREAFEKQMNTKVFEEKSSIETIMRTLGPEWNETPNASSRNYLSFDSSEYGRLSFKENSGWNVQVKKKENNEFLYRQLGDFKTLDEALKHIKNPKPVVSIRKNGEYKWNYASEREFAVMKELDHQGYTVKVNDEQLKNPYYLSRSETQIKNWIERTFKTKAQRDKFLNEQSKRDNIYTEYRIVDRDMIANAAAYKTLTL